MTTGRINQVCMLTTQHSDIAISENRFKQSVDENESPPNVKRINPLYCFSEPQVTSGSRIRCKAYLITFPRRTLTQTPLRRQKRSSPPFSQEIPTHSRCRP